VEQRRAEDLLLLLLVARTALAPRPGRGSRRRAVGPAGTGGGGGRGRGGALRPGRLGDGLQRRRRERLRRRRRPRVRGETAVRYRWGGGDGEGEPARGGGAGEEAASGEGGGHCGGEGSNGEGGRRLESERGVRLTGARRGTSEGSSAVRGSGWTVTIWSPMKGGSPRVRAVELPRACHAPRVSGNTWIPERHRDVHCEITTCKCATMAGAVVPDGFKLVASENFKKKYVELAR
jgi:hypothetical protein